jgi:DNA (cytosine-5)-methyltransferase 1
MDNLNFIEVCSGCGGLSSGFIKEGFFPIFFNELDKTCCKTLKKNHPDTDIKQCDMNSIDFSVYNDIQIDVLMGGVPCQSFSQAGKRKGLDDSRGNLILSFSNIIKDVNPRSFLIENVVGLTTHNNGETFNFVLKQLNSTNNYKIYHKVLNANDYGVAQKRKRLFIVGIRNDIDKEFKFPEPESYKPILRDVLIDVPESEGLLYSEEKKKIMDLVPEGGCWVDLPEDIQKDYMKKSFFSGGGKRGIARRLSMNEPSLTLTTSPCQKQTERCHPLETRPLTVREYARIQSFPDDFEFCGSKLQQYKQIGNAVPVKLAECVARSLKSVLE